MVMMVMSTERDERGSKTSTDGKQRANANPDKGAVPDTAALGQSRITRRSIAAYLVPCS